MKNKPELVKMLDAIDALDDVLKTVHENDYSREFIVRVENAYPEIYALKDEAEKELNAIELRALEVAKKRFARRCKQKRIHESTEREGEK